MVLSGVACVGEMRTAARWAKQVRHRDAELEGSADHVDRRSMDLSRVAVRLMAVQRVGLHICDLKVW